MSLDGTFRTSRSGLTMSHVHRGVKRTLRERLFTSAIDPQQPFAGVRGKLVGIEIHLIMPFRSIPFVYPRNKQQRSL